jgi:hypothetical protein
MPVSLTRSITTNEARFGEILGKGSVDKRADGIPVGLGLFEEGLGEFIWSTLGVDLDKGAINLILLLVEGGVFGGGGGLLLIDDLLACGACISTLCANRE